MDLDTVIHALYGAALEPDRWASALELVGDALGGCALGTSVQRSSGLAGTIAYARLDPHYFKIMMQQFPDVRANEMVAVMSGLPAAVPVARQAVKPDEAYFSSKLYNEIFAPQGLAHSAVACAFRSADCFVPLGIFRRKGQEEFSQREFDILRVVLPHMQRALQMGERLGLLEARQAVSDDLLDRLPFGVFILDGTGAIRFMNSAAQEIVAASDGLSVRQGRIRAASSVDDATLRGAIATALRLAVEPSGRPSQTVAVSRPSAAQPLLVLAAPAPASEHLPLMARGGAIVFVTDPNREVAPDEAALVHVFDLTPTQAKLAALLAAGESLEGAARRMGMAASTARVHVKSIFRKMDVGRQSDLIRLILNSAVVLQKVPSRAASSGRRA